MQKTSNQLRSNIANAARHRGDKVSFYFITFIETQILVKYGHLIASLVSKSLFQNAIHNHIRLFEPLVIKALKQYTTSTSVALQRQVLDLLAQLVQLRVNYCLLDSDQVQITGTQFYTGTGSQFGECTHLTQMLFPFPGVHRFRPEAV